jgi:hypothetical protein
MRTRGVIPVAFQPTSVAVHIDVDVSETQSYFHHETKFDSIDAADVAVMLA